MARDHQRGVAETERVAANAERDAAEIARRSAAAERDETAYQNYRSSLLAADLSLQAGEITTALQRLEATDASLRG